MTFARTGDTATRVNAIGLIETVLANKPRLDYLGSTCPKLLLEPQRTNLLLRSDDLTLWQDAGGSVTANTAISPDGTQNADTLTGARFQSSFASNTYTGSCFAKAVNGNFNLVIRFDTPSLCAGTFNLNNGTIIGVTAGYSATITPYPNGWYRCTVTTPPSTTINNFVLVSANGGSNSIYVYGAQLEPGAYATSYIPTTTASVTRNAETCYKASVTSLIGQTEGTGFINFIYNNTGTACVAIVLNDTTNDNRVQLEIGSAGGGTLYLFSGGNLQVGLSVGSFIANTEYKIAFKYKLNDVSVYKNGIKYGPDTSATMPTSLTRIELGSELLSSFNNYKIKSVSLWKTALTDQELLTLTTI
jgi:hypothetical protein